MITRINESKTLTKYISCEYKYVNVNLTVENVIQIKSGKMINVDVSEKTSGVQKQKRFWVTVLFLNFLLNGPSWSVKCKKN